MKLVEIQDEPLESSLVGPTVGYTFLAVPMGRSIRTPFHHEIEKLGIRAMIWKGNDCWHGIQEKDKKAWLCVVTHRCLAQSFSLLSCKLQGSGNGPHYHCLLEKTSMKSWNVWNLFFIIIIFSSVLQKGKKRRWLKGAPLIHSPPEPTLNQ